MPGVEDSLKAIHWEHLRCVFIKAGFKEGRHRGINIEMTKAGAPAPVLFPTFTEVQPKIIINNVINIAKLSWRKYFTLLKECEEAITPA